MIREISQHVGALCINLHAAWREELKGICREARSHLRITRRNYLDLIVGKGSSVASVPAIGRAQREPIRLCLESGLFLTRQLHLPKAAVKDLRRILLLELERGTPFTPKEVFHGWQCKEIDHSAMAVNHVIVKREILQPWLDYLFEQRVSFSSEVVFRANPPLVIDFLAEVIRQHPPIRRLRRIRVMAFAAVIAAAIACAVGAHWRQSAALEQLESDLAAIRQKAAQVRAKLSNLDAVSKRSAALYAYRSNMPSTLDLWHELTGIVPDSAWLSELRIEKGEISMSGFAHSSAALLAAVENSPIFEKAAFTSPIMKAPAENFERFALRATLTLAPSVR